METIRYKGEVVEILERGATPGSLSQIKKPNGETPWILLRPQQMRRPAKATLGEIEQKITHAGTLILRALHFVAPRQLNKDNVLEVLDSIEPRVVEGKSNQWKGNEVDGAFVPEGFLWSTATIVAVDDVTLTRKKAEAQAFILREDATEQQLVNSRALRLTKLQEKADKIIRQYTEVLPYLQKLIKEGQRANEEKNETASVCQ